jgi:hypothetical protein
VNGLAQCDMITSEQLNEAYIEYQQTQNVSLEPVACGSAVISEIKYHGKSVLHSIESEVQPVESIHEKINVGQNNNMQLDCNGDMSLIHDETANHSPAKNNKTPLKHNQI